MVGYSKITPNVLFAVLPPGAFNCLGLLIGGKKLPLNERRKETPSRQKAQEGQTRIKTGFG